MASDAGRLSALLASWSDLTAHEGGASGGLGFMGRIRNATSQSAEVLIYDQIGEQGVSSAKFMADLRSVDAKRIDVRINSRGGSAFDGIAIYTALIEHKAHVTTWVDGLAASAASFIAQAGDERVISEPARMMIHNAMGVVAGFAKDMRAMGDLLDQVSGTIADIYAARSGKPASVFLKAMDAETWYGSAEAVAMGLADSITQHKTSGVSNDARSQMIKARARVARGGK